MADRPHWWPAYIGIGSNLDSPREQVEKAIIAIAGLEHCFQAAVSSLYRSKPMGPADQPDYINAVVAIMTLASPAALLEQLQQIEKGQGRERDGERWGPRTIDLDLLMHGQTVVEGSDLTLPHPGIALRSFVLLPFAEIAADVVVPGLASVASLFLELGSSQPAIERLP
jgi:2-amino-4-hydroxy-6-hydroxymethyldihydropteridine diphosphokinase